MADGLASGIGRDGGDWSFDFYMETKNVAVAYDTHKVPRIGEGVRPCGSDPMPQP
jgi:hypothetical protein